MADPGDSSPPQEALTAFQVTVQLVLLRREIRDMRAELATAKANDERFLEIERHFRAQQKAIGTMKKYVGIAVAAAVGALGTTVVNRMAARVAPAPPPVISSVASTAIDRVPEPPRQDAGRP